MLWMSRRGGQDGSKADMESRLKWIGSIWISIFYELSFHDSVTGTELSAASDDNGTKTWNQLQGGNCI